MASRVRAVRVRRRGKASRIPRGLALEHLQEGGVGGADRHREGLGRQLEPGPRGAEPHRTAEERLVHRRVGEGRVPEVEAREAHAGAEQAREEVLSLGRQGLPQQPQRRALGAAERHRDRLAVQLQAVGVEAEGLEPLDAPDRRGEGRARRTAASRAGRASPDRCPRSAAARGSDPGSARAPPRPDRPAPRTAPTGSSFQAAARPSAAARPDRTPPRPGAPGSRTPPPPRSPRLRPRRPPQPRSRPAIGSGGRAIRQCRPGAPDWRARRRSRRWAPGSAVRSPAFVARRTGGPQPARR